MHDFPERQSADLHVQARAFRELANCFEREGALLLAERALARAQEIERRLWSRVAPRAGSAKGSDANS